MIGASGDLARKKTYPALFGLFKLGLLPTHTTIIGYARSPLGAAEFAVRISQAFAKDAKADEFLKLCSYFNGGVRCAAAAAVA